MKAPRRHQRPRRERNGRKGKEGERSGHGKKPIIKVYVVNKTCVTEASKSRVTSTFKAFTTAAFNILLPSVDFKCFYTVISNFYINIFKL